VNKITRSSLAAVVLLAALLVLAASAVQGQYTKDVKETVLDNGLRVLTKEVHMAPVVSVRMYYKVGSRNEYNGITGISHICEHMVSGRASANFASYEIERLLGDIGAADENAETYYDYTAYYEKVPAKNLETALMIEAERMQNALFLPEEFAAERTVVLSEFEGDANNPGETLSWQMWPMLFQQQSYHWPVIGWKSDIENVTRDQAFDYYKAHYEPGNATLVLVGDFQTEDALELAKRYFDPIPEGAVPPQPVTAEYPQRGERRFVLKIPSTEAMVRIGYHTPKFGDADYYALDVLSYLLSGGRSSRLIQSLVESGETNSAFAWHPDLKDPGMFLFGAGFAPEKDPSAIERMILDEIEKAKAEPASEKELERVKKQVRAYFVLANDSVAGQAENLGLADVVGSYKYLDDYVQKVSAVTAQDIMRVAREYLTEDNRTVGYLIPTGEAERPAGPTGFGPQHYKSPGPKSDEPFGAGTKMPFLSAIGTASAQGKPLDAQESKPERKVFDNGLVVIVKENHFNPSVSIVGLVKAGPIYDPPDMPGLSAFVAGCLDRGTTTKTSLEIAEAVESLGAEIAFERASETIHFEGTALSEDFETVLGILADCLINPSFDPAEVEKARKELSAKLKRNYDDTNYAAFMNAIAALYPKDHPYHHDPDGDLETLAKITRDDLVAFHKANYGPDTTVVVVSGDVQPEMVFAAAEKAFGGWARASGSKPVDLPPIQGPAERKTVKVELEGKVQGDFAIMWPGIRRDDPDWVALSLANTILGEFGSGRIYTKVRSELGLAYYASSFFSAKTGQGYYAAYAGANPANMDKAIERTFEAIDEVKRGDFTQDDLELAKNIFFGQVFTNLDTNAAFANELTSEEYYGLGLDYTDKLARAIEEATLDQVKAAASKHLLPENAIVSIAEPAKPESE
jgi:zinc protease